MTRRTVRYNIRDNKGTLLVTRPTRRLVLRAVAEIKALDGLSVERETCMREVQAIGVVSKGRFHKVGN